SFANAIGAILDDSWGGGNISGRLRLYADGTEVINLNANVGVGQPYAIVKNSGSFAIQNSSSVDLIKFDGSGNSFINTGNLAVDTNTMFVDAVNNRVGIGTATPQAQFEVLGDNIPGVIRVGSSDPAHN